MTRALRTRLVSLTLLSLAASVVGCTRTSPPRSAPEPTTANATNAETHLRELCTLIAQRLELMPGVARAKWNRKLPITDLKREQALLEKMVADGVVGGLPAEFVTSFFQAQMTAARLVQERAFAEWTTQQHPPFPDAPDLERDIRPRIDDLNRQMLAALKPCWAGRGAEDWTSALERAKSAAFPAHQPADEILKTALQPLHNASLYPAR